VSGPLHHCARRNGPPPHAAHGEDRFADAAARLAGLAGVLFGWSPDDFWRATPAELAAVGRALAGDTDDVVPPDAATLARLKEMFPDG
jgi:uncharacterized phage protein (TIGR02216 family)